MTQEIPSESEGAGHTGSISATPGSIIASSGLGTVQLAWTSEGATALEVRVGSPDGPLLARTGPAGHTLTGPWVTDGTAFFLQDVSDGRRPGPDGTLDRAVVRVRPPREGTRDRIYEFAAYLGQRFGCTHVVVVDPADEDVAPQLALNFRVVGVGLEPPPGGSAYESWIAADLDAVPPTSLPSALLETALVLYTDTTGRLARPGPWLDHLISWLDHVPVAVVTSPVAEGRTARAEAWPGEPGSALDTLLRSRQLNVAFGGLAGAGPADETTALAILDRGPAGRPAPAPASFRVTAIMTAYNEEDIIVPSIQHLLDQGIAVHLVENWSTDATHLLAETFSGHAGFTMERFPADGPSPIYHWQALLERVDAIARTAAADWVIHHDVDEVRSGPWEDVSLRDALYHVDRSGCAAVDHTVLEFYPVDEFFPFGGDLDKYFRWFDFGRRADHFSQVKAWKNTGRSVDLAASGGHHARVSGRIYPYKFLLKHYSVRSQAHGERKVFVDRRARWDPRERARGWHAHYEAIREGHRFVREAGTLELFERERFDARYLIERLSGVGIRREAPSISSGAPRGPAAPR